MVVDENGCIGNMNIIVIELEVFVLVIFGNLFFCVGNMIILDVGLGFISYLWFIGEISVVIIVDIVDIYSVIVMDVNGCFGFISVLISENGVLLVFLGLISGFSIGLCQILDNVYFIDLVLNIIYYVWIVLEGDMIISG